MLDTSLENLKGKRLVMPRGGLNGSSAGAPVETLVVAHAKRLLPGRVVTQHEAVNAVLLAHPEASAKQRFELLGEPALARLLSSPNKARAWRPDQLSTAKQDDTADLVIFSRSAFSFRDGRVTLGDAKGINLQRRDEADEKGTNRGSNMISASKLFAMARYALEEGYVGFDIVYLAIGYRPVEKHLVVEETRAFSLFNLDPQISINWTASQTQADPLRVALPFTGSKLEWCDQYEQHYLAGWEKENTKQQSNFAIATQRRAERPSRALS